MPTFYQPPGPYIGGHQPYDPGRSFPQAADRPPPLHPGKRRWLNIVNRAWEAPFPGAWEGHAQGEQPYGQRKLYPSLLNVPPDNPKFGHPARLREWLADVRQSWELDIPQPQRLKIHVEVNAPSVKVPELSLQMQNILQAWDVPVFPQQPRPDVVPGRADYPPPFIPQEIPQAQIYWQQEALPPIAALIPTQAGPDNPPWQHPAQGIERYIYAYDPKLWREHGGLGMSVGPPEPPPQPDLPPPYSIAKTAAILALWEPDQIIQIDLPSIPDLGDNPPPPPVWLESVISQWQPPGYTVPGRQNLSRSPTPDNPPPYSIADAMQGPLAWPQAYWTSPQRVPFPQARPADQPPGYTIEQMLGLVMSWPQPQWTSPGRGAFTRGPIPDNPPVKGVDNLRNILRAWDPPDPMPWQKFPVQLETGPEPVPPVPPEEEATRLGRAWWGWESFDGTNRPWWYKTLEDKRKELERQRKIRIALGILPADEDDASKKLAQEAKAFNKQTPTPQNVDQMIARYEALADRIEKMVDRMQEQDDEEAIMQLLKDLL